MFNKLPSKFNSHFSKITVVLVIIFIFLIIGGFFLFRIIRSRSCVGSTDSSIFGSFFSLEGEGCFSFDSQTNTNEVDLPFDPEGPYGLLYPRSDGNALILNLKRTASYDKITYELAYTSKADSTSLKSDGEENTGGTIDRGVIGEINTNDKKGEYEQEILFGTCSKNVCKYDSGVENGTLTLHIRKGKQAFKMITLWHLQKPNVSLGRLVSGDNHLIYQIDPASSNLQPGYSIVNDLSGAPKLPSDKVILGKVYGVNAPVAKSIPGGEVTIELADLPLPGAKIARFDESANKWIEFDTKIEGNKLTTKLDSAGIVTVLAPK